MSDTDAQINLVADIGGTNTRVAAAKGKLLLADTFRRYRNRDFDGPSEILEDFTNSTGIPEFRNFCVAVAGPVLDGCAKMANIDWTIDGAAIGKKMNISTVLLINDLTALGHSLSSLKKSELLPVLAGAKPKAGEARLVVNIGTGFNTSTVLTTSAGEIVASAECGHASLPAHSRIDFDLHEFLSARTSFVCIEDILSGRGIETVYAWLSKRDGGKRGLSAAEISNRFGADALADRVGRVITKILGTVVGDLALMHLPYGGIYLTGSVAKALGPSLERFGFAAAFMNKGRYTPLMAKFSIRLIDNDFAPLLGCASRCTETRNA